MNGAWVGHARRWLHAVLVRHHAPLALRGKLRQSSCAPRTIRTTCPKPRGKQDWQLEPHSIWYPRTTGIWQTVWLELVPATCVRASRAGRRISSAGRSALEALHRRGRRRPCRLSRDADRHGGTLLADDRYRVVAGEVHRRIALSDPGIDDSRNELLWSPESPDPASTPQLDLWGERRRAARRGAVSYTALRSIAVQGDRFVLNGRPYLLRMVLDQGYWPETRADRARRRRAAARRRAREGDGLQRRAQAPEDRGPALPLLGRPRSVCWCGRRCRAPTASPAARSSALTREWTRGDRARLQPPVHHRLGAVQRVVGRAGPARQSGRARTTCRRSTT